MFSRSSDDDHSHAIVVNGDVQNDVQLLTHDPALGVENVRAVDRHLQNRVLLIHQKG